MSKKKTKNLSQQEDATFQHDAGFTNSATPLHQLFSPISIFTIENNLKRFRL